MSDENNAQVDGRDEKAENYSENMDEILEQISNSLTDDSKLSDRLNISFDNAVSPVNMIVNLGSINGGIYQQQNSQEKGETRGLFLEKGKDFSAFVKEYKNSSVLSAMIVTAVLEIVPDTLFSLLCQQLEKRIGKFFGQEDASGYPEKRYDSLNEMLSLLKAEKMEATLRHNGGDIPIQCIVYSDPSYPEWIRREIWSDYLEIREAVTEWIFVLKDDSDVNSVIYYQIVKGIEALARLDYSYAVRKFIDPVEMPWKAYEISFMVRVFKALYGIEGYKKQVEQQMCYWLRKNDPHWRIAYQLYIPDVCREWTELLQQKLVSVIEKDKPESEDKAAEWHRASRGWLIVPARINYAASKMLVSALAQIFEKARIYYEKEAVATYYLLLFRDDYIFANYQHRKMALIDVCNDLDVRKKARKILLFAWHTKKYRDVLFHVLELHLKEKKRADEWEYMQWFLKTLAFTGESQDFNNMHHLLEQSGTEQAKNIADWIDKLLRERTEKRNG